MRDPQTNEIIDEALVLWFPAPHSETGEDVAELQLHGGRAVIAAMLAALGRIEGLRPAEAGEFTRRAFENGKLDLTAVEGLADLVMRRDRRPAPAGVPPDEGPARQPRRDLAAAADPGAGAGRGAHRFFRRGRCAGGSGGAGAWRIARELADEIAAALADGGRGERLREGLVVAIAGPPNAGKSTLLNRIARREAAIVSPYAGTTRDVIEVHLDLGGLPVTLLDTAGIRETDDPVELEGVRRARERAAGADLVLWVVDASEPGHSGNRAQRGYPESGGRLRNRPAGFRVHGAAPAPRNDGDGRPRAAAAPSSRDLLPAVEIATDLLGRPDRVRCSGPAANLADPQ